MFKAIFYYGGWNHQSGSDQRGPVRKESVDGPATHLIIAWFRHLGHYTPLTHSLLSIRPLCMERRSPLCLHEQWTLHYRSGWKCLHFIYYHARSILKTRCFECKSLDRKRQKITTTEKYEWKTRGSRTKCRHERIPPHQTEDWRKVPGQSWPKGARTILPSLSLKVRSRCHFYVILLKQLLFIGRFR